MSFATERTYIRELYLDFETAILNGSLSLRKGESKVDQVKRIQEEREKKLEEIENKYAIKELRAFSKSKGA